MTHPTFASLSPLFCNVRNASELRGWLMRAYFNPTKHALEYYYRPEVTRENVLEFISDPKNLFPQSPFSIMGIWGTLPSLREGLKSVATDESTQKEAIYTKGEKTLSAIGEKIGNVTATMVNKISDAAVIRLTVMTKALSSENKWLAKEAHEKIENAILNTAELFADAIQKSNDHLEVLKALTTAGLVANTDFSVADTLEREALDDLILWAKEGATQVELEDVFIADLKKSVNVFNLAQLAVSKQIFPPARRGRPAKNKEIEMED